MNRRHSDDATSAHLLAAIKRNDDAIQFLADRLEAFLVECRRRAKLEAA